jgi:formamidopyrimidine-DNA glycosylase
MPELPEVETVRRGIAPHVVGKTIVGADVRESRLRWPVTPGLKQKLRGNKVMQVDRRGKYLLLHFAKGILLTHLGMSGRLCIVPSNTTPVKHDHIDIKFSEGFMLRFSDPRRFGAMLWVIGDPMQHPLLASLGPEPLGKMFNSRYLFTVTRNKKVNIKNLVMDSHVVVGVGNIYANEALFVANINPLRAAGSLDDEDCQRLVRAIRQVLRTAIKAGGTTLRDFISATGKPGYFQQQLQVYGREGLPCLRCGTQLTGVRVGQRSTVYCPQCQPTEVIEKTGRG